MKKILVLLLTLLISTKGYTMDKENTLYLDLDYGRVVIEMLPKAAPKHVARIKELVRQGFYDGIKFHRPKKIVFLTAFIFSRSYRTVPTN